MTTIHLKPHESSAGPMCDAEAGPVELADPGRTYSAPYCVDCTELWRRTQRGMGVNVALLDCQRWDGHVYETHPGAVDTPDGRFLRFPAD